MSCCCHQNIEVFEDSFTELLNLILKHKDCCNSKIYFQLRMLCARLCLITYTVSQDYDLASRTTNAVCVNFILDWRGTYIFKSIPNDRFFKNFSWQFLFTLRVLTRNLLREEIAKVIFFSYFHFNVWFGV